MNCFNAARYCTLCADFLPSAPKPIIQGSPSSQLLIIGQAPGIKAHDSNKPWNDASGVRLRSWLGMSEQQFYDQRKIAILPMGFCYPGKGRSGDLPPRKECAPKWHHLLIGAMQIEHIFLIGQYAQNYYLNDNKNLTQRVKSWRDYHPKYVVLPHPSPRNNIWLKRHSWFEEEVVPAIRQTVQLIL
jgi:uracil-DNA glycosylase